MIPLDYLDLAGGGSDQAFCAKFRQDTRDDFANRAHAVGEFLLTHPSCKSAVRGVT